MSSSKLLPKIIAIIVVAGTGWLIASWLRGAPESSAPSEAESGSGQPLVRLTAAKEDVAGIETTPVENRNLLITRTVPGRFAYDDRQHVAVRTPADGILDAVFAKPGDRVPSGEVLAVVRSPEIGNARSDVLQKQDALTILQARHTQIEQLSKGVDALVEALKSGEQPETIQNHLKDATLGQYRGQLLATYSKYLLATQMSAAAINAGDAISGRVAQQRISEAQQARAELEGAIEQATFESQQNLRAAAADLQSGQRDLFIARQKLATLLGLPQQDVKSLQISPNESALSRLEIKSPINGTVERRQFSATERVTGGDELFIVADTGKLWIEADVRGRDWNALQIAEGHKIRVTTPALPGRVLEASVHFVGREVNPATGAIPLVAELENPDGLLRPGLFARVELPVGSVENVNVVPASAVIDLQGDSSVFVAAPGGYRPTPVQIGARSNGEVEIREGLKAGQRVVSKGAFVLKSELLLEGEE